MLVVLPTIPTALRERVLQYFLMLLIHSWHSEFSKGWFKHLILQIDESNSDSSETVVAFSILLILPFNCHEGNTSNMFDVRDEYNTVKNYVAVILFFNNTAPQTFAIEEISITFQIKYSLIAEKMKEINDSLFAYFFNIPYIHFFSCIIYDEYGMKTNAFSILIAIIVLLLEQKAFSSIFILGIEPIEAHSEQ
uniref:Uncharacterized protein n=1 Tax=Onchocerca volvulus TaxID=6282 RepID=A0A8R1TMC7_ONCVO